MPIKISDRDKKLLLGLVIGVILFIAYKLFTSLSDANVEKEAELKTLKETYADLSAKNGNRKRYVEDTEEYEKMYQDVVNSYNTSLSQEQILVFLGMVEKNTGVWLKQTGLSNISSVYTFGEVTSTNPATAGQKVYTTDYTGISTQLNLSYECTYDDLKKVLQYLEDYGKKATVNDMSFSYSESTDIVTGSMSVTMYAITGSDREVEDVTIRDVAVGTDNIFSSDTFITIGTDGSYRDKIINDYDLYLIMNQTGSDMDTVAMGQANDPSNETAVSSDKDGLETVELRITGTNGNYKVSYKVGGNLYPAMDYKDGAPLICGDSLDFLIISKPRTGIDDNTRVNLTIINESDMTLNVATINDDTTSPRLNIESTQGTVVFYNE